MDCSVPANWLNPMKCVALGVVLAVLAGCRVQAPERSRQVPAVEEIPVLWQKSGTYSRLARAVRVVVRDRAALARLPLAEVPVDFETQMVLVCGLGPVPDDRRGVRIVRVWREGETIHVQERVVYSDEPVVGDLRPASPWTVAIIPRSDMNVAGYSTRLPEDAFGHVPGGD